MSQSILIAGQGVMGENYTRNLLAMARELDIDQIIAADIALETCRRIKQDYPQLLVYHLDQNAPAEAPADKQSVGTARSLQTIIAKEKPSFYVGATQTDTHIQSLSDALSAIDKNTNAPYITAIVQEKPFGLFETDTESQRAAIESTIQEHGIIFNLDSILMFSGIWQDFETELGALKAAGFAHTHTACTYGKNRLGDTRPAHEGLFGTEGTHGLDIARRQGMATLGIQSIGHTTITQGFVNAASPDAPYYCKTLLTNENGAPIHLEMALNFDKKIRRAVHHYKQAGTGHTVEIEINFDTTDQNNNAVDRLQIRNHNGDERTIERPAGEKLANALRASFGQNARAIYGIENTNDLRAIMQSMRGQADYTLTNTSPDIIPAL